MWIGLSPIDLRVRPGETTIVRHGGDGRLTGVFDAVARGFDLMQTDDDSSEFESVTIEFDEDTIEALDEKAFTDHRDNRAAAIRDCLDEWLKQRASE